MLEQLPDLKSRLSKRTIRDQIAERIARMIQSGLLRVGDELPSERDLAQTLDVSRETVRGAVQMLAAIGMVEISQGARTRIIGTEGFASPAFGGPALNENAGVSRYSADEVYRARKLVEMSVVREAALRMDEATLARVRGLVEAQAEMTDDPVRFQISDVEFHALIYGAGGNALLAHFLNDVYTYALDFRRQALLVPGAVLRSFQDHKRILKAMEARDPDAAMAAMEKHLTRVHRTTLQVMPRG